MIKVKLVIGADHGGFTLKERIKKWLESMDFEVEDLGTFTEKSCDYPDFAGKVAGKVSEGKGIGLLFCGTGIGMCMAANKVKGIRAALVFNEFTGKMAREHNNANVLCLGGRTTSFEQAKKAINAFLKSEFQGGRHLRRVNKIMALEK